ncbi:MAG: hypothetical protein EOO38_25520 [Cytophagaceae bacterium]|nr:MAG: hypothetical protein EOO38_25520 [Cytophagaceae bacterium]
MKKTTTSSTATNQPTIYISHPADYSGDAWHVAAAMVLRPEVYAVVTAQSKDKDSKDSKESTKFLEFYSAIGATSQVCDRRQTASPIPDGPKGMTSAEKHRWPVKQHALRASSSVKNSEVGTVYTSTSVIIKAVMDNGIGHVNYTLRDRFRGRKVIPNVRSKVDELMMRKDQYVIVNMRSAEYNRQHNINEHIYKAIKQSMGGIKIIPFGNVGGCHWLQGVDPEGARNAIDLYEMGDRTMQTSAYFWALLAEAIDAKKSGGGDDSGCLAVIGGRSGSLDLPAFMGMRTICWDVHDKKDVEYARLHLAAQFMSVIGFACSPGAVESEPHSWVFKHLRSIDTRIGLTGDVVIGG